MKVAHLFSFALAVSISIFPQVVIAQSIEHLIQLRDAALKNKQSEAEAIWREVVKRDPKNAKAYLELGNSLWNRNRDAETAEAYQKAIELAPTEVEGYLGLAKTLEFNLNQEDAAIAVYRKAIAVAKPSSEVYYMLGITLTSGRHEGKVISEDRKNEAIDCYRKAIKLDPESSKAYIALANNLRERGESKAADAFYLAAMELDDVYSLSAYYIYTDLLEGRNRLNEMVPIYQKSIQRNPKSYNIVGLHLGLGNVLKKLNRSAEASDVYQQIIQIRPENTEAYFELGDMRRKQGKLDQSISLYQRASEMVRPESYGTNTSAYAYSVVGRQLEDRGQYDLAVPLYQKALAMVPDNPILRSKLLAKISELMRAQKK
jgi:tetratricopeptide (TPR) repeat protein